MRSAGVLSSMYSSSTSLPVVEEVVDEHRSMRSLAEHEPASDDEGLGLRPEEGKRLSTYFRTVAALGAHATRA